MSLELLLDVIKDAQANSGPVNLTSDIKRWLGRDCTQSVSVKLGNYLEDYFNLLLGSKNILHELDIYHGKPSIQSENGEWHQIDILARVNGRLFHREMKCNLSLGRGPSRDIRGREEAIVEALMAKYDTDEIDSRIFCPFQERSFYRAQLGTIEGLNEFICTFMVPITWVEFRKMGESQELHDLLFN